MSGGWKQRVRSRSLGVLWVFLTFMMFHWKVDVRSCWPVFMSVYTSILYQMHVRTFGTIVHNFLQNQEVFPYKFSLRYGVCFLKIAAGKLIEVFTGVSSRVHATQHCLRCETINSGILYFVNRASRYKFLLITNLAQFFMYLFIYSLYMFWASQYSSSGDRIVLIHHLVWLVRVSDCLVCRSGWKVCFYLNEWKSV
jgi:hypothetical protein